MMPYTKPALRFTLWCVLAFLVGSVQARGPQDNYGEFEPSSFSPRHEVVLVGWDTEEGQTRLARAAYKADFFQLASNFQPQANPLYCGIASSVIVLNAMRLHKNAVPSQAAIEVEVPEGLGGGRLTYPAYSQLTLLGERTESVKPRAMIELRNAGEGGAKIDPGLTLAQLKGVLEAYDTRVALHYAHQEPEEGAVCVGRFDSVRNRQFQGAYPGSTHRRTHFTRGGIRRSERLGVAAGCGRVSQSLVLGTSESSLWRHAYPGWRSLSGLPDCGGPSCRRLIARVLQCAAQLLSAGFSWHFLDHFPFDSSASG